MKIVIDSSVIVSFFFKDIYHDKAIEIFRKLKKEKTENIISTIALPEVCSAIIRQTNNKDYAAIVKRKIEKWIKDNFLKIEELTKERMLLASSTAIEFGLKGVDAIVVSLVKELKASLLTFDEEIKRKIKGKIKLFEL
jgi:predicted nucleic acid-binding protein